MWEVYVKSQAGKMRKVGTYPDWWAAKQKANKEIDSGKHRCVYIRCKVTDKMNGQWEFC